jgi:hypothetical protein
MLWNFLKPELSHRGFELSIIWFQQDGATAHTARASMEVIQEMFPEHIISLRSELPWPACSPDLSACDYSLWGYLKAKPYTTRPRTIDDLKITVQKQISVIPENMASSALEECVHNDGQHLSDLLFETK